MHTNYIQMPPDGVGKKVIVNKTYIIPVDTVVGVTIDTIINNGAGATLIVKQINTYGNILYCMYNSYLNEGAQITLGQTLYAGTNQLYPLCTVTAHSSLATPEYYYCNMSMNVSYDNPYHGQIIDAEGQAYVRFAEGSPSIDAYGNLRTSQAVSLGAYEYSNGDMADLFQDNIVNNATIQRDTTENITNLLVTNDNGSSAIRSTNRYHYYQPGIGNLIILTLYHGDTGKTNNIRRWGYFDNDNGIFFELDQNTLYAVIRSKTSGIISNTKIAMTDWNGDKLDGLGHSGITLDITKSNFYFIDFAWLGVGAVRVGIMGSNGSRIICHTFQNPNNIMNGPFMQRGSLPVRYENYNIGSTSGISELKLICTAVYAESSTNYTFWRFSDIETSSHVLVTNNTPILSMTPVSGTRVGIYPDSINVCVSGGNIKLSIIDDMQLTGATWGITGGGIALGDITATSASGGELFRSFYVGEGVTNINLSDIYETNDEGYHRLADDLDGYTFTLTGTKLTGDNVTVTATLGYKELR